MQLKKKQQLFFAAFIVILLIAVALFWWLLSGTELLKEKESYKAPINSPSSGIDPREIWVDKISVEQDLTSKRIENLEKMVEKLLKFNNSDSRKQTQHIEQIQQVEQVQQQLQPQPQQQQTPQQQTPQQQTSQSETPQQFKMQPLMPDATTLPIIEQPVHPEEFIVKAATKKRIHTRGITHTSVRLKNSKTLKSYDNSIPAGAFAQAVLLGGVDASTSIQASSDPRPILLRVTAAGTLPRRFKSDLCDCHVLAASYGDVSSERVFMRLEKLTCMERKTGEVLEMPIDGYVAGEDGRAGLRGTIVDRAGANMRNAAIGGFLSGIGSFLSTANNNPMTFSLNSGLAQSNPLTNGDMLKHGVAKGASSALEKYADFYIKRAEQMQPVLQVEAGRIVDIVFTKGVRFEDSAERSELIKQNDQKRLTNLEISNNATY